MVVKIKNSVVFITTECVWEEKRAVYSKAFVPGIPLETNPFNRAVRLKLLSIIVWRELEVLWWISPLLEWVPETKQIYTPISCEICGNEKFLLCQFTRLSQVQKAAPAFEQFLWDTHFAKQENLLFLAKSRNVCFEFVHWETEKCLQRWAVDFWEFLFKKLLQFMVVEITCSCSHRAICQSFKCVCWNSWTAA